MTTKTGSLDIAKALEISAETWVRAVLRRRWSTAAQVASEVREIAGNPVSKEQVTGTIKSLRRTPPPNTRLCSIGTGVRETFRLVDTSEDTPELATIVVRLTDKLAELRGLAKRHVNCPADLVRKIAAEIETIVAEALQ